MGFLKKLKWYDDELALKFIVSLMNPNDKVFVPTVRAFQIQLNYIFLIILFMQVLENHLLIILEIYKKVKFIE